MPLYEYKCTKCGSGIEILHKVGERPRQTCQKCGGRLEKMLSAPAIQFKGSGWYVTDYARKQIPEKTQSPKDQKKPETKAEKSPAAGEKSSSPQSSD